MYKKLATGLLSLILGACAQVSFPGAGSGSADSYEEDDLYTQAKDISVGSSQSRNFADDDTDWVKLTAVAGYTYTIETSNLGTYEDTILALYDSSLIAITSNDDGGTGWASRISWTADSSGTYYILVSSWGSMFSSGREYTLSITASAPTPQPDLSMASMTVPSSVASNDVISITDTIDNSGTADAGSFYVDYYISTNTTISTADTYIGSRQITSLAASASDTATSDFAVPGSLTEGTTYYVGALIDGTSSVSESNESNNVSSAYAINVTAAVPSDLTISGLSTSASVNAGEAISVVDTVTNSTARSNGIDVYYYLSTDATVTTTDTYLGNRSISTLDVGASDTGSGASIVIPRDMAVGSYYVGAIVDPTNTVLETDDTNNTSNVVSLTVNTAVPSDLAFSSFTPDSDVSYYDTMDITDTIVNQGSGDETSFVVDYYISTDAVIDNTDTYLGSRTISSLAAAASDTATMSFSLYQSTGTYYVGAIIDEVGSAIESDTTNNTSSVVTVNIINPDLAMGAVAVPASGDAGGSISIGDTVTNVGSSDINNSFTVSFYISTDATVTTADTYLGSRTVYGLGAALSDSNTGSLTLLNSLASGDYYIAAIADPYDYLYDVDTSNNTSAAQLITVNSCSPDAYEEDDDYTTGTAIGVGGSQTHNFCTDANDWLAFSAVSGTSYTIETSNLATYTDTILYLMDTDGVTQLVYDDDGAAETYASQIVWTAPATGTYYIRVASFSSDTGNLQDYTVSLSSP